MFAIHDVIISESDTVIKMLLAMLCKEITQRFSLADSVAGLGLPLKTGHCLGVLNPSLCIDHLRMWTLLGSRKNPNSDEMAHPIIGSGRLGWDGF